MDESRLQSLLDSFSGKSLLVVGDIMLDEFIWGKVSRISPEAPVPVVEVDRESFYPGGAANVARNLRPFAREVAVLGRVGSDAAEKRLRSLLEREGILQDYLITDASLPTTVKTRIIARNQQVVRVDREKKQGLDDEGRNQALQVAVRDLDRFDAVIVEDYGKGFVCQGLVDSLAEAVTGAGKPIAADPHYQNPLEWRRFTAVKPNRIEAFAAAGQPLTDPVDPVDQDEALAGVGRILMERWQPELLLITLGEQGIQLFRRDQPAYHSPTRAREVFDVSGAGDTAIALFTLALCSGATAEEAAEISNHASGVVVGKLGTATLNRQELVESFRKCVTP